MIIDSLASVMLCLMRPTVVPRWAVKTLLRAKSHTYIIQELRHGPYFLQFIDIHAGNIFVDTAWNVTGLIDLEWSCALPSELFLMPYWQTGYAIDEIEGENSISSTMFDERF